MRPAEQQKSFQNVFRIPRKAKQPQKPTKKGNDALGPGGKGSAFRPRKAHKKSRLGCQNCKRRHVRCDETLGGCLKCKAHGIDCDYAVKDEATGVAFISTSSTDLSSSLTVSEVSTPSSFTSRSLSVERMLKASVLPIEDLPRHDTFSHEAILHHFYTATAMTCGSPTSQAVHGSAVVAAAVQTPFLMNALLGLAAAHLRHLTPRDLSFSRTRLKVAECHYWAEAFNGFRRELAGSDQSMDIVATKRSNVNRENMDQLLSCLMLVSMHQFSYRDYQHTESNPADKSFVWIEDRAQRDAALKWLGVEAGFKGLIGAMAPWLRYSFWLPIMRRVDVDAEVDLEAWLSGEREPPKPLDVDERKAIDLCGITTTSKGSNPYYTNVETLIWCRSFRPIGPQHFNELIAWVGRTTPAFRELVLMRDTSALVVLLQWLHLMYDIGQWWIVERCHAEIRAIVTFVLKREVGGSEVFDLLRAPAAAVGIIIPERSKS